MLPILACLYLRIFVQIESLFPCLNHQTLEKLPSLVVLNASEKMVIFHDLFVQSIAYCFFSSFPMTMLPLDMLAHFPTKNLGVKFVLCFFPHGLLPVPQSLLFLILPHAVGIPICRGYDAHLYRLADLNLLSMFVRPPRSPTRPPMPTTVRITSVAYRDLLSAHFYK